MNILIGIFTFILIILSVFLVLLVLMQKSKNDGGMGAALGGGAAEATFGADTGNVLTKATRNVAIAFFVLSLGLYLAHIHQRTAATAAATDALPEMDAPAAPATLPAPMDTIQPAPTEEAATDQP